MGINLPPPPLKGPEPDAVESTKLRTTDATRSFGEAEGGTNDGAAKPPKRRSLLRAPLQDIRTVYANDATANAAFKFPVSFTHSCRNPSAPVFRSDMDSSSVTRLLLHLRRALASLCTDTITIASQQLCNPAGQSSLHHKVYCIDLPAQGSFSDALEAHCLCLQVLNMQPFDIRRLLALTHGHDKFSESTSCYLSKLAVEGAVKAARAGPV